MFHFIPRERMCERIVVQIIDVSMRHREGHPSKRVFSTQWNSSCTCHSSDCGGNVRILLIIPQDEQSLIRSPMCQSR